MDFEYMLVISLKKNMVVLGHFQPNFECRLYNYYTRRPDRQTKLETCLNRVVKLFSSCVSTSG